MMERIKKVTRGTFNLWGASLGWLGMTYLLIQWATTYDEPYLVFEGTVLAVMWIFLSAVVLRLAGKVRKDEA